MLRNTNKTLRRLAGSIALIGAIAALGASTASAASFTPAGPIKMDGTLTWKLNGGTPTNCTFVSPPATGFMSFTGTCANGKTVSGYLLAIPASSTTMTFYQSAGVTQTPFTDFLGRTHTQFGAPSVPFVNGNVSTPSRLEFDNTFIGWLAGGDPITLTGSLNVTTASGGLVTLN